MNRDVRQGTTGATPHSPLKAYLRLGLGIALLALLVVWVDFGAVWSALLGYAIAWLCVALPLTFLLDVISALKLHLLIRDRVAGLTLLQTVRLYLVSGFFGSFLPTSVGGDAVKVAVLVRRGGSVSASGTAVIVERLSGLVALWVMAGALVAVRPEITAPFGMAWIVWPFLVATCSALAMALLLASLLRRPVAGFLRRESKSRITDFAKRVGLSLSAYASRPRLLLSVLCLSAAFHLLRAVLLLLLARGFGHALPPAPLMWALLIVTIASMAPFTIGALGVREGALTWSLMALGLPAPEAVAVALLSRLLSTVKALTGGLLYAFGHGNAADTRTETPETQQ
jgi:uncharacterized protein (TIRG00374 family)